MPAVIVAAASSRVGGASRASMLILPPNATALPALHHTAMVRACAVGRRTRLRFWVTALVS